ncbi:two-component system, OmpR family, phosphate regulon sensor histidine kinase PhoR [Kaistella chaponensis]|jgi:signal transduction histidine kinase|uniref:histidine kinase n=1 Tax=Kaistella chaponensis TaxID=713588 RepID=A0A1N7NJQ4_9FLAO|nr:ATP-binding protein [Kaistella chaponensis]SIS98521.1 two-component system, OmpR family, phosphate regulon sensor histidine kinase PhoR [Kaistella chaponensis]HPW89044.1 ATP-binding protein [Kaistella chaponensis]
MRFHKLTLLASVFLTIAMSFIALVFDYTKDQIVHDQATFNIVFISCVVLIFVLNYIILDSLFTVYGKKQIRRISTILPNEFSPEDDNELNFQELGEMVSQFSQKNATELDTMKEMEIYRKEYIGNVSHELKTPLFSIQGYLETLIDGGVEDLAIRDKYLERIDKSVERLLTIVKDLDMINQYESGEISLNISIFDINVLIKEIIDLLDLEAQKKDSKVQLQTSSSQILVKADKHKIAQVLINLISNAIHYANRDKAQIIIRTNILKNKVLVEVKDNGMGIKPENLPRIFERFYRVETSRNRTDGGSGLGLAIVKHILEAHGENISVQSVYLEGTQFSFLLEKSI